MIQAIQADTTGVVDSMHAVTLQVTKGVKTANAATLRERAIVLLQQTPTAVAYIDRTSRTNRTAWQYFVANLE